MATRLHLRNTRTASGPKPVTFDLSTTAGTTTSAGVQVVTTAGGTELPLLSAGAEAEWASERLAAEATISNNLTCEIRASETNALANASIRLKVFKITAGGSDVETLIAEGDNPTELATGTGVALSFTLTLAQAITIAEDERLILRAFAIPASGQTMAAGHTVTLSFNAPSINLGGWIELVEAVTFKPNGTKLFLRRTAVAAIGNFFDALTVRGGSAFTTGVVNTTAGGTDIQWTRTAGGTVLEWISPRLSKGFTFIQPEDTGQFAVTGRIWALESATAANCAVRLRVFRWRNGTETQCADTPNPIELTTSAASQAMAAAPSQVTTTDFLPDDRVVCRLYITNVGTMGGARTCTVNYDHNAADVNGDSYITLFEGVDFKAEGDPGETGEVVSGQSTLGLGNAM